MSGDKYPGLVPSSHLAISLLDILPAQLLKGQRARAPGKCRPWSIRARQRKDRDGTQVNPAAERLRSGSSWRTHHLVAMSCAAHQGVHLSLSFPVSAVTSSRSGPSSPELGHLLPQPAESRLRPEVTPED